ncbi:helix-turn-helix domain-containing protein [Photobacterium damselae]|uniref:helix-turn-helix domain-containing protein n=1 Tax=Photobacterium damselae TaxID=38293 RepID=UPI00165DF11E|nr:helix-turn-helix domain-containing protein [Photobacterium damselae]
MARPAEITNREIEIIKKLTEAGASQREIADYIGRSFKTVANYQIKFGFKKPTKRNINFYNIIQ